MSSAWVVLLLGVIALSSVFVAATFLWLANSLVRSTGSLKTLIEETDSNVQRTVNGLRETVDEISGITHRINNQMDRIDGIVGNIEHIASDAQSTMHMVDESVLPVFTNVKAIAAGLRRGMEVWSDTAKDNAGDVEGKQE